MSENSENGIIKKRLGKNQQNIYRRRTLSQTLINQQHLNYAKCDPLVSINSIN